MSKKLQAIIYSSEELLAQWDAQVSALFNPLFELITNNDYATPQGGTKFKAIQDFMHHHHEQKVSQLIAKMSKQISDLEKMANELCHVDRLTSTTSLIEATKNQAVIGELIQRLNKAIAMHEIMVSGVKAKKAELISKMKMSSKAADEYADNLVNRYDQSYTPTHVNNTHMDTWRAVGHRLESINSILTLNDPEFSGNQLSMLLHPDNAVFLDSLLSPGRDRLYGDSGELVHIIVARLKDMYHHIDITNRVTAERINAAIYYINNCKNFDNQKTIYYYDINELKNEIIKLLIHTAMNNGNKDIIIGTASSVIREKTLHPGAAMYLNCSDDKWSWGLNRAYFEIAKTLGYQIRIVDKQFPNIEKAIISGSTAALLVELVRQIRPASQNTSTQYHGGDQPTATPLECLAIMDSGFSAKLQDGFIVFDTAPKVEHELKQTYLTMSKAIGRGRSHSAEPAFRTESRDARTTPSLHDYDPFFVPGDSVAARADESNKSMSPSSNRVIVKNYNLDGESAAKMEELMRLLRVCEDLKNNLASIQKEMKSQSHENPLTSGAIPKTEKEFLNIINLLPLAIRNIELGIYKCSDKENIGSIFIDKLIEHTEKSIQEAMIIVKLHDQKTPAVFQSGRRRSISNKTQT